LLKGRIMPDETPPTHFGLMRHAPTLWNRNKRIQGRQDSDLTAEGKARSKRWGVTLAAHSWHRILSSDLGRALKTAERVNRSLKVPLMQTPLLREMDWGDWTGRSIRQITAENPGLLSEMEQAGWEFKPPGGEDRNSVWSRTHRALMAAADTWDQENILVVTHEGVIKCLVYRLLQRRYLPDERPILKPNYLHFVAHDGSGLKIEKINAMKL
jgi:broad specificity phosphatase PhoE